MHMISGTKGATIVRKWKSVLIADGNLSNTILTHNNLQLYFFFYSLHMGHRMSQKKNTLDGFS